MFSESVFIECLKALGVMSAVVGEPLDSSLCSFGFRVALIDKSDSVLHGEVIDRRNEVRFHLDTPWIWA